MCHTNLSVWPQASSQDRAPETSEPAPSLVWGTLLRRIQHTFELVLIRIHNIKYTELHHNFTIEGVLKLKKLKKKIILKGYFLNFKYTLPKLYILHMNLHPDVRHVSIWWSDLPHASMLLCYIPATMWNSRIASFSQYMFRSLPVNDCGIKECSPL